jgi:hypothetical protein
VPRLPHFGHSALTKLAFENMLADSELFFHGYPY